MRKTEGGESNEWLFDLSSDIGEERDLLSTKTADTTRLKELLSRWELQVKPSR